MADYPSVLVTGRIPALLDYIKRVNRPAKVTQSWLESGGFKSTNDRAFIGLLKALAYIDASAAPTDKWNELKGSEADRRASLGRQLEVAYPEVFKHFPIETFTGLNRDELKNFIRPRVNAGEPTVDNIASTVLALRALADFRVVGTGTQTSNAAAPAAARRVQDESAGPSQALNVTINLTLEIPPTSDADVYDKLFEAMARHLGGLLKTRP